MQKSLLIGLLFYCTSLWAGLGDPMTYTLSAPPNNTIEPSPFSLPVPTRPTTAHTEHTEAGQPFNARLDTLWGPKKIRVQHAPNQSGLTAVCNLKIGNSLCQANSMHVLTDQSDLIKAPLEKQSTNYIAVSNFTDYFDMRIQGNTACKVDVSCEYMTPGGNQP